MGFLGRVENLTDFSDFKEIWFYRIFDLGSLGSHWKSWMGFLGRVENLTDFSDFLKRWFYRIFDFGSLGSL